MTGGFVKKFIPQRSSLLLVMALALGGVFLYAHEGISADWGWLGNAAETMVASIITAIIYALVWVFGLLVTKSLIPILVMVASYNDFATEYGVQLGWTVVRDVSNMFFIVILLVIAVATIFKVESYSYRALLPKLLIMAVLINFSKMITGLFIDFAQIVMLTFVNSFRDIAGGNIVDATGIGNILSFTRKAVEKGQDIESLKIFGALLLGLAITAITAGVLLVFILVLVFRVIMLWTLTVLSPLAYLLSSFPGGQKYASQWWEKFTSHLIVGPVLAFFLWLSFAIMNQGLFTRRENSTFGKFLAGEKVTIEEYNPYGTEAGATDNLINFIIVIALLLGSLTLTQQLGVMGGQFAGQVSGKLQKLGVGAASLAFLKAPAVLAEKIHAGEAGWLASWKQDEKTGEIKRRGLAGIDLNPFHLPKRFMESRKRKKEKEEVAAKMMSLELMKGDPKRGRVVNSLFRLAGMLSSDAGHEQLFAGLGYNKLLSAWWRPNEPLMAQLDEQIKDLAKQLAEREDDRKGLNAPEAFEQDMKMEFDQAEAKFKKLDADVMELERFETDKDALPKELEANLRKLSGWQEGLKALKDMEAKGKGNTEEYDKLFTRISNQIAKHYDQIRPVSDTAQMQELLNVQDKALKAEKEDFQKEENVKKRHENLNELSQERGTAQVAKKKAEDDYNAVKEMKKDKKYNELRNIARKYYAKKAREKSEEAMRVKNGGLSEAQKAAYGQKEKELELKRITMQASIKDKQDKGGKVSAEELRELELIQDDLDKIALLLGKGGGLSDVQKNKLAPKVAEALQQAQEENKDKDIFSELKKEAKRYSRQANRNYSEADRERIGREVEAMRKTVGELTEQKNKIEQYIPQDYYALRDARSKIMEEARKIVTDNEDELISLFRNATANHDRFLAAGIAQHAAEVGHLNELVNEFGIPGQDQSDVNGLNTFINKNFIKHMGMNPQWAYAFQNNLSDIAQGINHWSLAQSVGVENGRYFQRDLAGQRARVLIETSKRDSEHRIRNANRLGGWFTEYWRDSNDHSKGRRAQLNEFGLLEIRNSLQGLVELVQRNRMNPNVMLNIWTDENRNILMAMRDTLTAPQRKLYDEFERLMNSRIGTVRDYGGIDPDSEFREFRGILRGVGAKFYAGASAIGYGPTLA
ncbi:MAG: hypothetical protein AB1352_00965 [Patescibacteria group bacterium]